MKHVLHSLLYLLLAMGSTKAAAQQVVLHYPDGRQLKLHVSELDSISMHPDTWHDPTGAPNRVRTTLVADFEEGAPRRTRGQHRISMGTSDTEKTMLWETSDNIWVGQAGSTPHKFSLTDGSGTTQGEFEGIVLQGTPITAIYPYQEGIALSENGKVTKLKLPTIQQATPGSCDPRVALMIAATQNEASSEGDYQALALSFKNLCSYIEITPTEQLSQLSITAHDAGGNSQYLAGTLTANYNSGEPTWEITGGSNTVTLDGPLEEGTTYYIAVLPGTKAAGFSITCCKGSQSMVRHYDNSATFNRSKYHNCSAFTTGGTYSTADYVDMELTGNDIHRYWATRNLGAATPSDFGSYFAWGEVDGKKAWDNYNFTWPNYKWGDKNEHDISDISQASFVNKYKSSDQLQLEAADDAAYHLWGAGWQMPTKADFDALLKQCQREYTANYKHTGVNGFIIYAASHKTITDDGKVDTKNGAEVAHIFLPYGGYKQDGDDTVINPSSVHGYYWSSTVESAKGTGYGCFNYSRAYDLVLTYSNHSTDAKVSQDFRRGGQNIRAVYVGPR